TARMANLSCGHLSFQRSTMSLLPRVLLVNHREANCGVYQFGTRLLRPVVKSDKYDVVYIETPELWEFEHWANTIQPQIVVYNYYPSTMAWVNSDLLNRNRALFKQAAVFHEVPIKHMGFDMLLHQDPTNTEEGYVNLARPIPVYQGNTGASTPVTGTDIPRIGSFGFGLGGKGFTRIVD